MKLGFFPAACIPTPWVSNLVKDVQIWKKRILVVPLNLKRNPGAALAFTKKLTLCLGGVLQNIYKTWHDKYPSMGKPGWKCIYFQVGIELLSNNLS